jgi:hypothetical protein
MNHPLTNCDLFESDLIMDDPKMDNADCHYRYERTQHRHSREIG